MKVIANRQITGDWGTAHPGAHFECPGDQVDGLLSRGLVRIPDPPRVVYEVKVITPEAPAVASEGPFCYMPVPDQEPPTVAAEGDSGMESADVQEQRNVDPGGRRGRPRRNP